MEILLPFTLPLKILKTTTSASLESKTSSGFTVMACSSDGNCSEKDVLQSVLIASLKSMILYLVVASGAHMLFKMQLK